MTYEECVNRLPDTLKALGYKIVNGKMIDKVTNFHLDNDCQDCLLRIVHSNEKITQNQTGLLKCYLSMNFHHLS